MKYRIIGTNRETGRRLRATVEAADEAAARAIARQGVAVESVEPVPEDFDFRTADAGPARRERQGGSGLTVLRDLFILGLLALIAVELFPMPRHSEGFQEWEYAIVGPPDATFQETLDRLGAEGWEMIFKRPKRHGR